MPASVEVVTPKDNVCGRKRRREGRPIAAMGPKSLALIVETTEETLRCSKRRKLENVKQGRFDDDDDFILGDAGDSSSSSATEDFLEDDLGDLGASENEGKEMGGVRLVADASKARNKSSRRVSFGTVHVRVFARAIAPQSVCSSGCPMGIDYGRPIGTRLCRLDSFEELRSGGSARGHVDDGKRQGSHVTSVSSSPRSPSAKAEEQIFPEGHQARRDKARFIYDGYVSPEERRRLLLAAICEAEREASKSDASSAFSAGASSPSSSSSSSSSSRASTPRSGGARASGSCDSRMDSDTTDSRSRGGGVGMNRQGTITVRAFASSHAVLDEACLTARRIVMQREETNMLSMLGLEESTSMRGESDDGSSGSSSVLGGSTGGGSGGRADSVLSLFGSAGAASGLPTSCSSSGDSNGSECGSEYDSDSIFANHDDAEEDEEEEDVSVVALRRIGC